MASTGEVGCLGDSFDEALLKALLSVGLSIPARAVLISSGDPMQKAKLLPYCRMLVDSGYTLYATPGSQKYLEENGIPATAAPWPGEAETDGDAVGLIRSHTVDLVVNVPKNFTRRELTNGYRIRRAAVDFNVPLVTNARLASAFIRAFCTLRPEDLAIKAWDEY